MSTGTSEMLCTWSGQSSSTILGWSKRTEVCNESPQQSNLRYRWGKFRWGIQSRRNATSGYRIFYRGQQMYSKHEFKEWIACWATTDTCSEWNEMIACLSSESSTLLPLSASYSSIYVAAFLGVTIILVFWIETWYCGKQCWKTNP